MTTEGQAAVAERQTARQTWGRRRRLLVWLNVTVMVLVALGLLVVVNTISSRHYVRRDLTFSQDYTLTEKSIKLLEKLRKDEKGCEIYFFFSPAFRRDPELRIKEEVLLIVRDLIEEYRQRNPRITFEEVQFFAQSRERLKILAEEKGIGLTNIAPWDFVFVAGKQHQKKVAFSELYKAEYAEGDPRRGPGEPKLAEIKAEEIITSTIQELTSRDKLVVYFTTGHGEPRIDSREDGDAELFAGEILRGRENFEVRSLNLATVEKIPEDCATLITCSPQTKFLPPEIDLVRSYLAGGGRFLLSLDSGTDGLSDEGLDRLLKDWGIESGRELVLEGDRNLVLRYLELLTGSVKVNISHFFVTNFSSHPITEGIPVDGVKVLGACSVSASSSPPSELEVTSLMRTSPKGWGETDLEENPPRYTEGKDKKGPVSLAVASSRKPPAATASEELRRFGRVVAFGDSDMIRNGTLQNEGLGFSTQLFLNAIRWLSGQEYLMAIESRKPENRRVDLSGEREDQLLYLTTALIPRLALTLGFVVWLFRRP